MSGGLAPGDGFREQPDNETVAHTPLPTAAAPLLLVRQGADCLFVTDLTEMDE
jgi:hypothetical protein